MLHRLVDNGNTVLVIEHNLDVIKTADWIVDLGPEGGLRGGRIVAEGTPEPVAATPGSATGEYLARVLRGEPLVPLSDVTFADEAGRPARVAAGPGRRPCDGALAQAGRRGAVSRASDSPTRPGSIRSRRRSSRRAAALFRAAAVDAGGLR